MNLTPKQILMLAARHELRFSTLLEKARAEETPERVKRTINVGDCLHYKSVWGSIKAKGGVWKDMSSQERGEVIDAVSSGEFDDLLAKAD